MKILIHSGADITKTFNEAVKYIDDENLTIYGVYSRDINKAKKLSEEFKCDFYTDDFDGTLKSELYDTVYIATPNSMHYPVAKEALESHKNVIVEKPIALTEDEIDDLYEIAKKNNVHVFDACVNIYSDNYKKLKEFLKNENVHLVDFHYAKQTRHYSKYEQGEYFNVFDKKMGGGSLNDLGVYALYPLLDLFGYKYEVFVKRILSRYDADETALISGQFNNHTLFTIRNSKVVKDYRESVILTTNYTIEIKDVGSFDDVIIKDREGNIIKEFKYDKPRMVQQLTYFNDVFNNKIEFNSEIIKLSKEVRKIINKQGGTIMTNKKRLFRSTDDVKIGGVCAGIADYFDIDPTIVRLIAVAGLLLVGSFLILYIVCWIVIPVKPNF